MVQIFLKEKWCSLISPPKRFCFCAWHFKTARHNWVDKYEGSFVANDSLLAFQQQFKKIVNCRNIHRPLLQMLHSQHWCPVFLVQKSYQRHCTKIQVLYIYNIVKNGSTPRYIGTFIVDCLKDVQRNFFTIFLPPDGLRSGCLCSEKHQRAVLMGLCA
jgi:hypothetical protein